MDVKTMRIALSEGECKFQNGEVITADEARRDLTAAVVEGIIKQAMAGEVAAVEWLERKGFVKT